MIKYTRANPLYFNIITVKRCCITASTSRCRSIFCFITHASNKTKTHNTKPHTIEHENKKR